MSFKKKAAIALLLAAVLAGLAVLIFATGGFGGNVSGGGLFV